MKIDEMDLKIIRCLKDNARMSASAIGLQINMSVSAVIERTKKLEQAGIIKQYTLVIDHKKIGNDVTAFISVSLDHPKYNDSFIEHVNANDEVNECHYMTGDLDFILKIITKSIDRLTETLNEIKCIKGVSMTRTMIVLATTKDSFTVIPMGIG